MSDHTGPTAPHSSDAILLAEHERVSALYLHNQESGERRTSLFFTIISVGSVVLIGLRQLDIPVERLILPGMALVVAMVIIGFLTFQRLVERRVHAVEYLRAINRIHRYFCQRDHGLQDYFFWQPCDDQPSFAARGIWFMGLRHIVLVINVILLGVLGTLAMVTLAPSYSRISALIVGCLLAIVGGVVMHLCERRQMRSAASRAVAQVRFPVER